MIAAALLLGNMRIANFKRNYSKGNVICQNTKNIDFIDTPDDFIIEKY
jgi:hypothetical protein